MAFTLSSITREVKFRAPRIALLGGEKVGKTCFACGCRFENGELVETGLNSPIVIPIRGEEGTDELDVPVFPTCDSFPDVMECIRVLYEDEHKFGMIVLDSVSSLAPLINDDVCHEFGVENVRKVPGFRTGEAACEVRWRQILAGLDLLRNTKGMGCVLIGHTRLRKAANQDADTFDAYDFDLEVPISETIKRWADAILFAAMKVAIRTEGKDSDFSKAKHKGIDATGGQRYLFTSPRPANPSGGRGVYGHLPAEMPLDWAGFQDEVLKAGTRVKELAAAKAATESTE